MYPAAMSTYSKSFALHKGPQPLQTGQHLRFGKPISRSLNSGKMQQHVYTKAASEHTVITIGEALYGMIIYNTVMWLCLKSKIAGLSSLN